MKIGDYLPWYRKLLVQYKNIHGRPPYWYDQETAQSWVSEAGTALASLFPLGHQCRQDWDRLLPQLHPNEKNGGSLERMHGVFRAAFQLLLNDRIGSIPDLVRAETEDELLDQALVLLNAKHVAAAAAVIAGGALEAHLKHLATKNSLIITGDGSINKYESAIAKARNEGTVIIYPTTDSKLIGGWGGIRNDAAHDPGAFNRSPEDIRRMIEGIREFISRTS